VPRHNIAGDWQGKLKASTGEFCIVLKIARGHMDEPAHQIEYSTHARSPGRHCGAPIHVMGEVGVCSQHLVNSRVELCRRFCDHFAANKWQK
jgi:hypothetical protein